MNKKSVRTDYSFCLSKEEIDKIAELSESKLNELEIDKKNVIRIRLGLEEMLLDLLTDCEGNEGVLSFCRKWGQTILEIKVKGREPASAKEDDFSIYSQHIIENMSLVPESYYKKGWNYIRLRLNKKESNPLVGIVIAVLLAALIGFTVSLLPDQAETIVDALVTPLENTFLGILTTISGPMIFVSIIWGILCIGDAATLGNLGKKLMISFVIQVFVMAFISILVGLVSFPLSFDDARVDYASLRDVYDLILSIFPSNIIAPFYENNAMQIIVLAIPIGIAALIFQDRNPVITDLMEQLNNIIQYIMGLIVKLIPFFVFLCLIGMFMTGSFKKLGEFWKLIILIVMIPAVVSFILMLVISWKYGIAFTLLLKKMLPTFIIAITTASSAAAFSTNIDCCEKRLGINSKITKFGIPLGMVIYMPSLAVVLSMVAIYMASVQNVSISIIWIITALIISAILAMAVPPVPGGSLTCYAIIFAQLGISEDAVALATILDIILDFECTAFNLLMLQIELILRADSLDLLDRQILKENN